METLNSVVRYIGSLGCLFGASFLMFYTLVNIRFYDYKDKFNIENRWKKGNNAGRLGGIGIFILFVLTMNMFPGKVLEVNSPLCMIVMFLICSCGFVDDVFQSDWVVRLTFYLFMSLLLASLFYSGILTYVLFVLAILFFINSFNMLDNMDLISPIIAIEILFFMSLVSWDFRFVVFAVLLLPFLYFNWLGKLMMGDCGSTVLGALFGMCAVWMLSRGVPWYSVLFIFIVPVADTVFVVVRRLVERRPLWVGGVDHLTHSLARCTGPNVAVGILSVAGLFLGIAGVLLIK